MYAVWKRAPWLRNLVRLREAQGVLIDGVPTQSLARSTMLASSSMRCALGIFSDCRPTVTTRKARATKLARGCSGELRIKSGFLRRLLGNSTLHRRVSIQGETEKLYYLSPGLCILGPLAQVARFEEITWPLLKTALIGEGDEARSACRRLGKSGLRGTTTVSPLVLQVRDFVPACFLRRDQP